MYGLYNRVYDMIYHDMIYVLLKEKNCYIADTNNYWRFYCYIMIWYTYCWKRKIDARDAEKCVWAKQL